MVIIIKTMIEFNYIKTATNANKDKDEFNSQIGIQ